MDADQDLTTIWDLEVGPGHRTADLVYVITNVRVHPEAQTLGAALQLAAAPAPVAGPVYHGGEPSPAAPLSAAPSGSHGAPSVRPESQQSRDSSRLDWWRESDLDLILSKGEYGQKVRTLEELETALRAPAGVAPTRRVWIHESLEDDARGLWDET